MTQGVLFLEVIKMNRILICELKNYLNKKVCIQGWIYKIRKLKSITFVILRDRSGLIQCIVNNNEADLTKISLESVVSICGIVKESCNKLNLFEVQVESLDIINEVKHELQIELNKENLDVNLDTMLNNRFLSLRHSKINSIFKIQNLIVEAFGDFLNKEGFMEIYTPKLVKEGAEGGTELFEVKYNVREATLITRDRKRLIP